MKPQSFIETEGLIYPGQYVPQINDDYIEHALLDTEDLRNDFPPIIVTELKNLFKVEVKIPSLKNENILIHADGNVLSIILLQNENNFRADGNIRRADDFIYQKYFKKVVLPPNADAEYCRAEYKSDILTLYLMKTKQPVNDLHARIVVY